MQEHLHQFLQQTRDKSKIPFILIRASIEVFKPNTQKIHLIESASNIYGLAENQAITTLMDDVESLDACKTLYIDRHVCKHRNNIKTNGYMRVNFNLLKNNMVKIIEATKDEISFLNMINDSDSSFHYFSNKLKKNLYDHILEQAKLTGKKIQYYHIAHQVLHIDKQKQYIIFFEASNALEHDATPCYNREFELSIYTILKELTSTLECDYFGDIVTLPTDKEPNYSNLAYWIKEQKHYSESRLKNGNKIANLIYINCIPQLFNSKSTNCHNHTIKFNKNFLSSLKEPLDYKPPHPIIQDAIDDFYRNFLK